MTSTGAGALASPLVATQFSQIRHWSFHYLASLGIAVCNSIILLWVFRMKTQDGKRLCYVLAHDVGSQHTECLAEVGEAAGETSTSEHSTFRQILSIKTVHLLAFFILVYVGVEVTIGGTGYFQNLRRDISDGHCQGGSLPTLSMYAAEARHLDTSPQDFLVVRIFPFAHLYGMLTCNRRLNDRSYSTTVAKSEG